MRRIGGNIRVVGLVVIVAIVASLAISAKQETPVSAQMPTAAVASPLGDPMVVPGVESLAGGQRKAAEQARHANPYAVVARARSRTAYEHLDASAAARLAREALPAVVAPAPSGLGQMPAGQRVIHYLNSKVAQVALVNGKRALAESLVPIAALTSSGRYGPLDLTLKESGGTFAPANSAVDVSIPRSLGAGFDLSSTGVSLTPVDGSGKPLNGFGALDGGTVFYAGSRIDTDTTVKPTSTGFEAYDLLRSIQSPQELSYRVGMPNGARLVPLAGGKGASQIVLQGKVIAVLPAPSAQDAEGASVPTSVDLSGQILHVRVLHRVGDYRYPIVVDPTVIDSDLLETKRNWRFEHSGTHFTYEESGEIGAKYWYMSVDSGHALNEWGAWEYPTQGESHIYALSAETQGAQSASNIQATLGIFNSGGWEAATTMPTSYARTATTVCVVSGCPSSGGSAANLASFWLTAIGTGTSAGYSLFTSSVYIAQTNGPSIVPNTTTEKSGVMHNVLYGSGSWLSKSDGYAQFEESDPGVGVWETTYTGPEAKKWSKGSLLWCASPVQCPETRSETIYYQGTGVEHLPDGEPTLEVKDTNTMGSSATTSVKIKVDGTAPTEIGLTGVPGSGQIGDSYRALKLTAKAKDGSGTTPSSGVASLKLTLDGLPIGNPSGACSPGPCTATAEWTMNAEEYGAGKHTLKVTATDKAGNVGTSETPITIHHAAPRPIGPGTVNPVSGEFELEESDVSIPTSGQPLTVARSYSSRDMSSGAESPLGTPWTISFGGAQKLTQMENGNMVLTAANGGQSTFGYNGTSHYDPPAGDAGLSLTINTKTEYSSFVLTDKGATTTFTYVEGDQGNVWRPTISTSTGGTATTTYSYQVVGGVVEPLEALGPVPAGVSCATELKIGCRALTFNYATSTTATGEGPSEWGDYSGHITRVYFTGYDTVAKTMTTTTVGQYAYDTKGRLRAEWDPRVSPALKTTFGYDGKGHVTALSAPGEEPWVFVYGTTGTDTSEGRVVSVGRPAATTALGNGKAPANSGAPSLSALHPIVSKALSVSAGVWSNSPLRYGYQWELCNSVGGSCVPIGGAINREYTPKESDVGSTLTARVTATSGGGSGVAATAASAVVAVAGLAEPQQMSTFGTSGTGNGQLKGPWGIARTSSGNVWVADTGNNRIEEFNGEGAYVRAAGTSGSGLLSGPEDIAVDAVGNAWVTDTGKSRVVEFSPSGEYVRAFGTAGTGNSQFKSPWGITVDGGNHVWVVDAGNNRVQEFTSEGTYMRAFGTVGTGNGQFKAPGGVAADSKGNVWIADTGNNRIQEFTSEGVYIKQFGSSGSGNGQFCSPWRLAVDPNNDQIWVADACNNRVQVFNSAGEFVQKFGSAGSGSGQFSSPEGIAFSLQGYVYILDKGNNRVTKWSDGAPQPFSEFGSAGTGNGQLKEPWGIAVDSSGNVWVADMANGRIEEFNSEGAYVRVAGSGLLSGPEDVAVDSGGDAWVTDTGKSRIVEFNPVGEYVRSFGTVGSGAGQFKSPWGIAVDAAKHVWVVDASNNRVQEFTSEGSWMRTIGAEGSGNGQFKEPGEVAIDSKGNVWVSDTGNNRIQEFTGEGAYIRQVGTSGSGNGQFSWPWRLAVDPNDHVWVADSNNNRVQVFNSEGAFIGQIGSSGSSAGQFNGPEGIAFSSTGYVYVLDQRNSRVDKWSGAGYWEGIAGGGAEETSLPASATSTIEYGVPVSGAGAPYAMSSGELAKWAQTDVPAEATAIFPPDEPMGWPATDYKRATIEYIDVADQIVNVARPNGGISTSEYNLYNDVVRTLSPDNRAAALKEGAKSAEVSQTLDTQSTYGSEGTELLSTLGPKHTVKLVSGTSVQARAHTVYSYDEGAPSGGPYRLATKVTEGAQITGEPEADVRTTTTSYAGQNNLGWILQKPTAARTDPSGLKLTRTTIYDPASGKVTETRTPAAGAPGEEILSGYIYKMVFGSAGSGNGQFSKPGAIARDHEGNLWVADTENNRVEEFSSGGTFVRQFGTVGSGDGQLSKPEGITVDETGRVWVADTGNNRIEQFSSTGAYVSKFGTVGTGWSQFKGPSGIVAGPGNYGRLYIADTGNNRLVECTISPALSEAREYGTSGSGNGQFSKPEGLAFDSKGDLWVADTGNNRVQEIYAPEKVAQQWVYLQQFGTLGTGNGQLSKPEGVAIDSEGDVFVADSGNGRVQEFSSTGVYTLQFGSTGTGEKNLKTPAGIVLDTSNDAYVLDTGNNRVQEWLPAGSVHESSGTGGTHGTQTIYYTAGTNSQASVCGLHPEWGGLPCETRPAAQPETSGIPNLPVTVVTYNIWNEPLTSVETVGATTRTTTNTYDSAGRLATGASSSTVGSALPTVKVEYGSETGELVKLSTTVESTTRSVEGVANKLGQVTSYTDADGNTSTFKYDVDGRMESLNDGKGTQTYTYDTTTGFLTKLVDSGAGTFTATYDAEGNLSSQGYPNGMSENNAYDAAGDETGLEYVKTTHCSSGCTWYSDSVVPSIHGQSLSQASTLSSQAYTYDAAGRLTRTQDTPAGSGCTTRVYALDQETNISSVTTRAPGAGGVCATEGGTVENRGYDSANRLIDTGIAYSTFGDITKLPAADAGGSELVSTFYTDGTLASQSQGGQTIGYYLDPVGRARQTVSTGTVNSTVTSHYSSESSAPAWTEDTAGKWTRKIPGIDGSLVATQAGSEAAVLQIENLHGDIVGTASLSETASALLSTNDPTEYGVPRAGSSPKYSWLGGMQLSTELPSGIIAMGARSYVPRIGRFLQPDPVEGGSANAYSYTYGDPVNTSDPSGEFTVGTPNWVHEFFDEEAINATETAIERAAEEQAAKEEAEAKAQEALEEAWAASSGAAWETGGGGKAKGKKAQAAKSGGGMVPLMYKPGGGCNRQCKREQKETKEIKKYNKTIKKEKIVIKAGTTKSSKERKDIGDAAINGKEREDIEKQEEWCAHEDC